MLAKTAAFEPGSLALAAYLLQNGVRPFRKPMCLVRMKRFSRKHQETLMHLAMEEFSESAVDLLNTVHLPHACSLSMAIYLLVIFVTILV